jgi:PAS domain S-box-containing protein
MSLGSSASRRKPSDPSADADAASAEVERLREFLFNTADFLWETDADHVTRGIEGRVMDVLGAPPSAAIGKNRVELMKTCIDPAKRERLVQDLEQHRPFRDVSYWQQMPRGLRHLRISGKPRFDEAGKFLGFRGTTVDITDEAPDTDVAEENQLRFDALVSSVPGVVYQRRLHPDGSVSYPYVSAGARDIYGYAAEEIMANASLLLNSAPDEDMVTYRATLARSVETMQAWFWEGRAIHKDGSIRWVQVRARPRRLFDGSIIWDGLILDVTDRKRAEVEMAEQARKIEAAAKELERSNKELEQFAYVASHDLQEPLRMVASYCQMLAKRYKGKLDSDADDFINFAVDGAKRMQELINDLLAYSRAGQKRREFAPTNCNSVVEATCQGLKAAVDEAGATVDVELLPTVMADSIQLGQVFQNLIGNALKFRGERAPVVRVRAERRTDDWLFSIADNGIGMAPEHSERIFLIFQRLHNHSQYPGTGIGLAVVKKIIERHGGRIWVESTPGTGSTFLFTLPIAGDGTDDPKIKAD